MEKLLIGILAILVACLGLEAWAKKLDNSGVSANNKNLIIYNWGDYIGPKLIKKSEKQTGCHVVYETFDSNEAMYTKVKQEGTAHDICVSSDYMISKMQKAKLLDKADTKKIPNYKNVGSESLHHSFDPKNTYSVSYFQGTLGIVYSDKFVKSGQIKHWNDLWLKDYRHNILLVGSTRGITGLPLASVGKLLNATNSLDPKLAKTRLDGLGPNVKAIIFDELKIYMIQNEAAVGVTWSGETRTMLNDNKHLHYVVPPEGSNLWPDNFVIPRTVKNKVGAYAFINLMFNPKNAAQNIEYIGYATPNTKAQELLPKEIKNDKQFYPSKQAMKNSQVYQDLGPKKAQKYGDLFLEFKMYG